MVHPKLRRASALALALSLLLAGNASAATRVRTHPHHAASSGIEIAAWLENLVVGALAKSGLRIDPDGAPH